MGRKGHCEKRSQSILVVDDQEEVLLSTRALLEREGYRVLTAQSAERALEVMKTERIDLLLVDYFMPRMSGEQLVRSVRAFDPLVQIILQTGYCGEKPPGATLADLDIQGYHDKADGPEKLLVWVAAGLRVQQMMDRARDADRRLADAAKDSPLRVMFIAPERAVTASTAALLESQGFKVLRATNPETALEEFMRQRPELAILDDAFFDQNGADLVRRMHTLDPAAILLGQCRGLDARQRRTIRRSLGLYAVHDKEEDGERLLELLDAACDGVRRLQRTRADSSLRGLILAKLCHELRSYLHVVQGYADILWQDEAARQFDPLLSRLAAASHAASELVQEYLDLAHLEKGIVPVRRELVGVDDLIAELRVHTERQIGSRPICLVTAVPVPGTVLLTDGEKVRSVLSHLLSNSVKLSGAGTIELAVEFAADRTDFTIRHLEGHGNDDLPQLFHSMLEGRDVAGIGTPGQGLALAIALRLSQLLGASLTADRASQGGASLTLRLPVGALGAGAAAESQVLH
ncbi:MAG: response regulator [Deltaproteobacteria bacterium]|nr:response regulator [Deltaproteobacteria bacterium]